MDVRDSIPEEAFEIAKTITLADLLQSDVARCETMSLISNVPRYFTGYGISNNLENQIASTINELKDEIPHKAFKMAFSVISAVKKQTKEHREFTGSAAGSVASPLPRHRQAPKPIPEKPCKPVLSNEAVMQLTTAFIKVAKEPDFKYAYLCAYIEKTYLADKKYKWAKDDSLVTTSNLTMWKQKVSNALQKLAGDQRILHMKKVDMWHILPTY